jgi:alkylation response protein AidB-like acyl-CoA dehydrogenase
MIPEEYGGAGYDAMSAALIIEEIARVDAAVALLVGSHNSLCSGHILLAGSEEQKKRYLPPLARGEKLGAWALTEPGSGSDAGAMRTRATLEGDAWIIRGDKQFITQGSTAGTYVIMASTDPGQGTRGISAFVVDRATPGLVVGKLEKKLGVRSSDTAALHFDDMRVPKENLLGKVNEGFKDVLTVLAAARIGMAALAVGIAQGALDEALTYAKRRGSSASRFSSTKRSSGCLPTWPPKARPRGCWRGTRRRSAIRQAVPACRVAGQTVFVGSAVRSTSKAIQIHGGYGYLKDSPVERFYRDAKLCEIGEGTSRCSGWSSRGAVSVKRIVIANCGGFWGDDPTAPRRQVDGGPINYLVMDYLAEVTMALLQKQRARHPETGFPADVASHLRDVLPSCVDRGIRIITNAGGVNPFGCRAAIEAAARDLGLADRVRVGVVVGDDMFGNLDALVASGETLSNMDTGQPLSDVRSRVLSANAYIGASGIVRALEQGANVVITGRVADAAVALAPMMFEFGWASDDWDRLAAGIVAGHIIECGAQCTGGNFTDWHLVKSYRRMGFPVVEVDEDGSFVVTKHPEHGGLVSVHTVTSSSVRDRSAHLHDSRRRRAVRFGPPRAEGARSRARDWSRAANRHLQS